MEHIAIAELKPELLELESKQIRGIVTLIWPYSSSARQFAVLLGDPNFRLRRKKGQVRVRFSGSSARAIASTGVGIGDEVVLSLRGAEFVRESPVNTPGSNIDWELAYTQTLSSRIVRDGKELADLELVDVAPTPVPSSPVRATPRASLESSHQWSSPAFLKRMRLSNGPVLTPEYDPFADDIEDGHAKKRRRRSYRDWNAWTYLARTPSPEKEDMNTDGLDHFDGSPIRPTLLPVTPVSPSKGQVDINTGSLGEPNQEAIDTEDDGRVVVERGQTEVGDSSPAQFQLEVDGTKDDFARDAEYYDLYAGPDERPPKQDTSGFEGDTEVDSNSEGIDVEIQGTQHVEDVSASVAQELCDPRSGILVSENIEHLSGDAPLAAADDIILSTGSHSIIEIETEEGRDASLDDTSDRPVQALVQTHNDLIVQDSASDDARKIVMPPPTLSLLQTDFQNTVVPGLLTPIGKEPSSPSLQPLDSSTLPMPSPFPGGRDGNISSYLDYVSSSQQPEQQAAVNQTRQELPDDEADYIMETSFYSSVSSSHAPAFHPMHESAFTDLRFTFGMDGATFSRPQSSSGAEIASKVTAIPNEPVDAITGLDAIQSRQSSPVRPDNSAVQGNSPEEAPEPLNTFLASSPIEPQVLQQEELSQVIILSPNSQAGDDERDEQPGSEIGDSIRSDGNQSGRIEAAEDQRAVLDVMSDQERIESVAHDHPTQAADDQPNHMNEAGERQGNVTPRPGPQRSTAVSEVIDLGSPLDDSDGNETSILEVETSILVDVDGEQSHEKSERTGISTTQEYPAKSELDPSHSENAAQRPPEDASSFISSQHNVSREENASQPEHVKRELTEEIESHDEVGSITETLDPLIPDSSSVHEDVKMESIEETTASFIQDNSEQDKDDSTIFDPNSELLIAVPEEGHKVGELQFVAVPDTAPARNTRSKTKTSMSPEKETYVSSQTPRSRKRAFLAPLSQLSQRAISPPVTGSKLTASPTKESFPTSPYSLRSQSKHLSPTKSPIATVMRTHARQRSAQTKSSAESSPQQVSFTQSSLEADDFDFPWTNFGPSQELGTLKGKFANVPYVKDSEEGSMHSERSLSTVRGSEDLNMGMTFSDPLFPDTQERSQTSTPRKARGASRVPTSPVTPGRKAGPQVDMTTRSTPNKLASPNASQLPLNSPTKSVRSVTSVGVTSSSPRRSRRINKDLPDLPVDGGVSEARLSEIATRDDETANLELRMEAEAEVRSSPPAPLHFDERSTADETINYTANSSRVEMIQTVSANQQSILPMTPEATQHTLVESQPNFPAGQEQSFPMTPQLTQSTYAAPRSFIENPLKTEATAEPLVEPSPASKTTPRRYATATDVASPSASPRPSVDSASEDEVDVIEVEKPSIGLSTPTAYYTPMKDLAYFLNRSSTFHSAGSPDVLALVTTASAQPTRASKGPRHWTTTLRITDLSIYPGQTTVQIFRPYENALPVAETGDVVLLRAFSVRSLNRHPCLVSADESAWCVWRYGKPLWGKKRGAFSEVRSREEVKGPAVERGEGEWREVEKLRAWYMNTVKEELEEKAHRTRGKDREEGGSQA